MDNQAPLEHVENPVLMEVLEQGVKTDNPDPQALQVTGVCSINQELLCKNFKSRREDILFFFIFYFLEASHACLAKMSIGFFAAEIFLALSVKI